MPNHTELFKIFSFNDHEIQTEMNKNPQPNFETVRTNLTKLRLSLLTLTDQIQATKDSPYFSASILKSNIQTKLSQQLGLTLENIKDKCEEEYKSTFEQINLLESSYLAEIEKIFLARKSIEIAINSHVNDALTNKKNKILEALRAAARDYRAYFIKKGITAWEGQFETFTKIFGTLATIQSSEPPYELKFTDSPDINKMNIKAVEKFTNDILRATDKDKTKTAINFLRKSLQPLLGSNSFCNIDSDGLLKLKPEAKATDMIKQNDGFGSTSYNCHNSLLECVEKYKIDLNKLYQDLNNQWTQRIETLNSIEKACLIDLNQPSQTALKDLQEKLSSFRKLLLNTAKAYSVTKQHLNPMFKCRDSIFEIDAKQINHDELDVNIKNAKIAYEEFLSLFEQVQPKLTALELDVSQAVQAYSGIKFKKRQARLTEYTRGAALIKEDAKNLKQDLQEAECISKQALFCENLMARVRVFNTTQLAFFETTDCLKKLNDEAEKILSKSSELALHGIEDDDLEAKAQAIFDKTEIESKKCDASFESLQVLNSGIQSDKATLTQFSSASPLASRCQEQMSLVYKKMESVKSAETTAQALVDSINCMKKTLVSNKATVAKRFSDIGTANNLKALILTTILDNISEFKASRWGGGKTFLHNGVPYRIADGVYNILTKVSKSSSPQNWLKAIQQIAQERLALNHPSANHFQLSTLRYSLFGVRKTKVEQLYRAIDNFADIDEGNAYHHLATEFRKLR